MLPVIGMPAAGIPSFCSHFDLNNAESGITIAKIANYHLAIEELLQLSKDNNVE